MKYLSLFSGIEAVSYAWEDLGFECKAVSEILEYQSNVIKKNFPNLKNLGDVTKIDDEVIKNLGQIDIVIFGSPCQDLSVAGKRQGLEAVKQDTNHSSNLFFEGVRVFNLAKKYCGARFLVWENVVGALNSKKGEDFGTVLETLAGCKFESKRIKWGTEGAVLGSEGMCEWAVLDAQWFGVPQRRRRVFVILDTGDWRGREPILLESESLRGSVASLKQKRENFANKFAESSGISIKTFDRQAIATYSESFVSSTLTARDYKSYTDLVSYGIPGNWIGRKPENGGNSTRFLTEHSPCLTATDHHGVIILSDKKPILRRLTVVETERLQGFPDGWTDLGKTSKSKRYNAIGRSMAVPVMKWIGKNLKKALETPLTTAI